MKNFKLLIFLLLLMNISYTITMIEKSEEAINFPDISTLETQRLVLRKIRTEDVDDFFAFTSDPKVCALTGMFELHKIKEEDTVSYIERMIGRYKVAQGTAAYWAIVHKKIQKVIGIIGIFGYMDRYARAEVGYALSKEYWNKGFATEALKSVIEYGFNHMKLNRIQGCADPENIPSIRVMQKNNMSQEGLLKEFIIVDNKPVDRLMYAILKRDYHHYQSEHTLALIKPDAVAANKQNEIIDEIKAHGFKIIHQETLLLSKEQVSELYIKYKDRAWFANVIIFLCGGPSVALILQKENAINEWRQLLGSSKPQEWGILRLKYAKSHLCNALHGADSVVDAQREINILGLNLIKSIS